MRRIKSIIKVSEQGVSRPYLCEDENDGVRWCKGYHTGFRSLISEWVCARLARELDLPVPEFGIFKLDCTMFREWAHYQSTEVPPLVTPSSQYVFGSLNVENCKDVFDPQVDLAHVDRLLLARIYHFDLMTHNTDRTDFNSNLLVNGRAYVIDHNNAFDPAFEPIGFSKEHILRAYQDALIPSDLAKFKARLRSLVQGAFLDEVWTEMPPEWIDAGEVVLPLETIRGVILEDRNG